MMFVFENCQSQIFRTILLVARVLFQQTIYNARFDILDCPSKLDVYIESYGMELEIIHCFFLSSLFE